MRTSTAKILRLPLPPTKLDQGPKTVAFVQAAIHRSGWSYTRIAFAADLSITTVQHIGTGETKRPGWRTIFQILTALGYDIFASEQH